MDKKNASFRLSLLHQICNRLLCWWLPTAIFPQKCALTRFKGACNPVITNDEYKLPCCVHHSPSLPHNTMTWQCATWCQTLVIPPPFPMSHVHSRQETGLSYSTCNRAAKKYRHASHEARYVVIYACLKSNEESLRFSLFLGSSTERITLYESFVGLISKHARFSAAVCIPKFVR